MIAGRLPLPNKRQRQTPRKSSTNTRTLSTRISNIQKEISPILSGGPIVGNPPAMRAPADVWIPRKVRCYLNRPVALGTASLLVSNLATELGLASSVSSTIKVLGIKAWNTTGPTNSDNQIQLTSEGNLTTSAIGAKFRDSGTATSFAGVKINIPDPLAKNLTITTSTSTVICTIGSGLPFESTQPQIYTVDVSFMLRV